MTRHLFSAAAFAGVLFLVPGGAAPPAPTPAQPLADDLPQAPQPRSRFFPTSHTGSVTEVTRDSITVHGLTLWIAGAGNPSNVNARRTVWTYTGDLEVTDQEGHEFPAKKVVLTREKGALSEVAVTAPDGTVKVLRKADEPLRRFEVGWELAAGGFPANQDSYRLADVRVGDEVTVYTTPGLKVCIAVMILGRPGGRVPPLPSEEPYVRHLRHRYHERRNALQDLEEKGIPLPFRFLNSQEQADMTAPPPHEKGGAPPIPPAAP